MEKLRAFGQLNFSFLSISVNLLSLVDESIAKQLIFKENDIMNPSNQYYDSNSYADLIERYYFITYNLPYRITIISVNSPSLSTVRSSFRYYFYFIHLLHPH